MTRPVTPKLETRSAEDIYRVLVEQVSARLPPSAERSDELRDALLRIFARYFEVVAERLNRVPDKHYLAFLNALGVSRIPPAPAEVPLTFVPVRGASGEASITVPAHTKVAAPPGPGEKEPIVFETQRPLRLTQTELLRVLSVDPGSDRYADHDDLASPEPAPSRVIFAGTLPVEHAFHIGHGPLFGVKGITRLRLCVELDRAPSRPPPGNPLEWAIPAPKESTVLKPVQDTTHGLTRNGDIVFQDLPDWPENDIFGHNNRWLSCRLLRPVAAIPPGSGCGPGTLPRIRKMAIVATWEAARARIDRAFFNNLQLDTGKDFFPFGERPRFGDVFYLTCDAFSKPGARVRLAFRLTNPISAGDACPIPPTHRQGNPVIRWEMWDGTRWLRVDCEDATRAFTEDGEVAFSVPFRAVAGTVNGQEAVWLRARLVSGHYGEEARFVAGDSIQGPRWVPSTLAPPAIRSIEIASCLELRCEAPEALIAQNNLSFETVDLEDGAGFQPFRPSQSPFRALYLGFSAPARAAFAGRRLGLYLHAGVPAERLFSRGEDDRSLPVLAWQYWAGNRWRDAEVADGTASLTRSGVVTVQTGDDASRWNASTVAPDLYWLKVSWVSGEPPYCPCLKRVAVNTVPASHTVTLENERLGSSSGVPWQTFRTARVPILGTIRLEVREPTLPGPDECARLLREEGADALSVIRDTQGRIEAIWVRWHRVEDFLSSTATDRHYVVDRLTGDIRFGDGRTGRIPPKGANNIRVRTYRTGGGSAGNVPPGTVTQLRTAIPLVASAVNPEQAFGGQDMEDWDAVQRRGSRGLRHRGRAVTAEDYEDLAVESSPEVARAKCFSLRDLVKDPFGRREAPGIVSVVVVPSGPEACPKPSAGLLERVRRHLDRRRAPDVDLVVLAPEYVRVGVEVEIAPAQTDAAVDVAAQCRSRIEAFLHPLTGGEEGRGFAFGQRPAESDLYALLEQVPGVEYVRSLRLVAEEERPGLLDSAMFLICPGRIGVRVDG